MQRSVKLLLMAAVLVATVAAAWWFAARNNRTADAAEEPGQQAQAAARPAVPVLAGASAVKDFAVVVRGIGSVQAFNTVTVKSRVDGNIVKVAFVEGQLVHKGELLMQIDPRPYQAQLEQAEATAAKDQANLENARRDLARYAALLPTQLATTRQQYDTQKALVDQLTAAVQADQAQVDAARLNVLYSAVASPIDGITGLRLVDIGNLVQASAATPLVVVTQIKPIYVTFTVAERQLDRIRAAMARHRLAVLAFNGDDSKELSQGVLKLVNNTVDQATGTVTLKAEFANQDAALWPGEFVNAHLVVNVVKNGVTVPASAVQMGPTGPFVYAVNQDSTAAVKPVTVVDVENGTALIGKGLPAGAKIVVSGQADLSPGAKVAVKPGAPGTAVAREPEIGPEGVGSTGVTTGPSGISGVTPR
ncbi:MAG TPA: efflux RND transporter periplasmic adaptor subunit [Stellaceae bacterium]|nr:efflux RND transporter periplasmic adaptor subunit [Stellaceae bacterium]